MFRMLEADTGKAITYVAQSPVGHFLLDSCFLEGLSSLTLIVNFNFCCCFFNLRGCRIKQQVN